MVLSLNTPNHPPAPTNIAMQPINAQSAVNLNLKDAKVNMEISCHPVEDPKSKQNQRSSVPDPSEIDRDLASYI